MNQNSNPPKKGILCKKNTLDQLGVGRISNLYLYFFKSKKDLTWDEKTIEEHDKERGKTMKITEPKTPYNNEFNENELHDHEIDSLKQAELNKKAYEDKGKLDLAKLNEMLKDDLDREQNYLKVSKITILKYKQFRRKEMAFDSDEEDEIKKKKKEQFEKKRKQHYNEGAFIKNHIMNDEEDDEK